MSNKLDSTKVFAVIMCIVAVLAITVAIFKPSKEVIPQGYIPSENVDIAVDKAVAEVTNSKNLEVSELQNKVSELQNKILEQTIVEEPEEKVVYNYIIDDITLGNSIQEKELSDKEIKTLFDGEIEFDDESYDFEEILVLKDLIVEANEEDFNGVEYLIVPSESISYKVLFDDELNLSEINKDETLKLSFLGNDIEISKFESNKITLISGDEFFLDEGETVSTNNKSINLEFVLEDSIYVTVDSIGEKISEGKTKKVNGIEITAKEILFDPRDGRISKAVILIGNDVEKVIESGDEYSEDSIFEYIVEKDFIGLQLSEEFIELDDEYKPLSSGEILCLPNDYVCIRFDGSIEQDSNEYSFEIDKISGKKYVEVEGKFSLGREDYDKVYLNESGIYDDYLEFISSDFIELADSDFVLNITFGLRIGDLVIGPKLSHISVDGYGFDIENVDEDFRTDFGILVKNPKDSVEDQEFNIIVPEERLEFQISVI